MVDIVPHNKEAVMSNFVVTDTGSKLIALGTGKEANVVEITDSQALSSIRKMIDQRRQIGADITKALKDNGMHAAKDDDQTVVIQPT